MTIRPFHEGDRAAVLALLEACGLTRPWNPPGGDDGRRGWLYYLSVQPGLRQSGLGQAFMTAAENWLRDRGCRKIELMVRNTNDDVIGFYEAIGYGQEPMAVLSRWLIDDPKGDAS